MNSVSKILSFCQKKERTLAKAKKPESKPEHPFREIYLKCLREAEDRGAARLS